MNPLARDTVTLYMRHVDSATRKDVWTRCVLAPVIWTQKTVRSIGSDGVLRMARQTSVTIDADVFATIDNELASYIEPKIYAALTDEQRGTSWTLDKGFVVVYGLNSQVMGEVYSIAMLIAASDC